MAVKQPTLEGKLIGLAGIFSKSATVPLHTWLPDAGIAPSTITSLLAAACLLSGIFFHSVTGGTGSAGNCEFMEVVEG
jgi:NADH:ubiquinone oxidoreductase subunit 5 (subunit L)/multisubunit Na+/H+ antiporter MnhA subunit